MKLSWSVLDVAWRDPLLTANGGGDAPRQLVLVRLETADGIVAHGEAAPLAAYDGTSLEAVTAALADYAPLLAAAGTIDGGGHVAVLEACRQRADLPQALAAVDMALWDLAGRRADKPVWWLLGAAAPAAVAVNAVIGAEAPAAVADAAAAAARAGYGTVKVKVGHGDDLARVRATRSAVGPDVAIRIDANGAFGSVTAATAALAALVDCDIELCEEPVHGGDALAAVSAASAIPIAVDESLADPIVLSRRVAALVCLKIAGCGGISGVVADAATARTLGYEPFLASTLDGPLGIAAALHAAVALAPQRACGLATLGRLEGDSPITVAGGQMSPPAGPGLGDGLLDWYAALAR